MIEHGVPGIVGVFPAAASLLSDRPSASLANRPGHDRCLKAAERKAKN